MGEDANASYPEFGDLAPSASICRRDIRRSARFGPAPTLNIVPAATTVAANQNYSLTFAGVSLGGNATIGMANNGTGIGSLTVGPLSDGSSAETLTFNGPGSLIFGSRAASVVSGTQINVGGGTLVSNNATGLGSMAAVNLASGATFNLGASQTLGALNGAGAVNLSGNGLPIVLTIGSSNNQGHSVSLSMTWRGRTTSELPASGIAGGNASPDTTPIGSSGGPLISDVVDLYGMATGSNGATNAAPVQTDPFVLQMSFDPSTLKAKGFTDANLATRGNLYLASLVNGRLGFVAS